jgi:hypothetical protein
LDTFDALLKTLFSMAWMVEARDPYTGGHLWRVSQYARRTAQAAGHPPAEAMRAMLGGFLHDLGKVGVPDAILRKPGRLDADEYAAIQTHPEVGRRLMIDHPLKHLVEAAIWLHHERPDGRGYPGGLARDDIPAEARIVAVCDAFDAMTSTRPYRPGMPVDAALTIIEDELDRQFDPHYGKTLIELARSGLLADITGYSEPGIPLENCHNCGPIILRTRHKQNGARLFCPNCAGEYILHLERDRSSVEPTGRQGTAQDLIAGFDIDLGSELIELAGLHLQPKNASWLPRWLKPKKS